MEVLIDNRQSTHDIPLEKIKRQAEIILNALESPDGELSILIVDDSQMSEFNRRYLQREGPTNVIAFPMRTSDFIDINPQLLGDVVISAETAEREGKMVGISFGKRFTQLLIHGVLHLFGYDHERSESEALRMENQSDAILKVLDADDGLNEQRPSS